MFSCFSTKFLKSNFEKLNIKNEEEIDFQEDEEIITPLLINSLELSPSKSMNPLLKRYKEEDKRNEYLQKEMSKGLIHCLTEGVNMRKTIFKNPCLIPNLDSKGSNIINNDFIGKDSEINLNTQYSFSDSLDRKMIELAKKIIEKDELLSISYQLKQQIEEESIKQNKIHLSLLKVNEISGTKVNTLKENEEEHKKLTQELTIIQKLKECMCKENEEEMKNLNTKLDIIREFLKQSNESLQKSKIEMEELKFNVKQSKFLFDNRFSEELKSVNSLKHSLLKKCSVSKEFSSNFIKKIQKLKSMIAKESIPISALEKLSNDKNFTDRFEQNYK